MSWLQFFASLASSLAWPVVAVIIVLALRKAILEKLPQLIRFKAKDFEAEFAEALSDLGKEVRETGLDEEKEADSSEVDELQEIAKISASLAVAEAYHNVERSGRELMKAKGLFEDQRVTLSGMRLWKALLKEEYIGFSEYKILDDLRVLRNKIVHEGSNDITYESAQRYIKFAVIASQAFEKAERHEPNMQPHNAMT
ncbi:hypothetical protein PsAD5_02540 [Pseudovibrio sp. Ad5]|uniref:hypothetical protein n=1 Tax=Pseudovibrio sp. Ad5 TaxID=989436 RepID=UPI0007B1CCB7|nr:hypothetical protein [Pseudovibrio sp. Ad5]KZK96353.1 hypothetical protein PsAD5_02540 [Pseudovibrio sp. Ad5]